MLRGSALVVTVRDLAGEPRRAVGGDGGLSRQAASARDEGPAAAVPLLRCAGAVRAPERAPRARALPATGRGRRAASPAEDRLSDDAARCLRPRPPARSRISPTTNVQEQGVDEPDVVKTAGGRIFAVAGGQLHAIDAAGPRLLGSLPLDGYAHELLLHGKRLLVMSQDAAGGVGIEPALSQPYQPDPVTLLTEVDVSDPAKLTVVRVQRVRGLFVSARLTGAIARVVVTSTPRATGQPELTLAPARLAGAHHRGQPAHGQEANAPRHALPGGAPGTGLLRARPAHRAHDRHGQGPARGGLRRRDDRRGDRVRVAAPAVRGHAALDLGVRSRAEPARGNDHPRVRRLELRRDDLPRQWQGARVPAQPVGDVRARRRAAGREQRGSRPGSAATSSSTVRAS